MAKSNKLANLIKELVKQEVKKQVTEIFIKEGVKSMTESASKNDVMEVLPKRKSKPKKEVTYTKNPVLNDILNETARTLGSTTETSEQEVSFTSQNAQGFNRSNLASMMGYEDFTPEGQRESVAQQPAQSMGISMDDLPDAVSKALTKDYSGLMKKIDEKKNRKEGFRP